MNDRQMKQLLLMMYGLFCAFFFLATLACVYLAFARGDAIYLLHGFAAGCIFIFYRHKGGELCRRKG